MSNAVISNHTKTYPVFEANQVLSADHLNDLRKYTESEIFSTRNQLIGVGIVSGLELGMSQDGISISGGAGISTDGYLISSAAETQNYRFVVPYSFQKEDDPLKVQVLDAFTDRFIEVEDEDTGEVKTVRQTRLLNNSFTDLKVSFNELVDENDTRVKKGSDSLPLRDVKNGGEAGVALYLETLDNDINSCFTTNCDERGIERLQTVRPLLIITNKDVALNNPFERPSLPAIPRLRFEHSNAPKLVESFKNACTDQLLTQLQRGISNTDRHLGRTIGENEFTRTGRNLRDIKSVILNQRPEHIPSFYEFIRDISSALNDLLDVAEDVEFLTRTIPDNFPQYLMLGPLNPLSERFTRTEFVPAHSGDENGSELQEIIFYWKRLHAMMDSFSPTALDSIKITPTRTAKAALPEQSMPAYYGDFESGKIHQFWNRNLGSEQVLSYFSEAYAQARQFTHPLEYEHENKDQLLVEGFMGMLKSDALEALKSLKKQHHLGFGIVALRLSSTDHEEPYPLPAEYDPLAIREDNFKDFIEENPGLYHARALYKDHTLALIFQAEPDATDGPIVGTMVLPYICCGMPVAPPAPFVLDAHDDAVAANANTSIDIDPLANDEFDPHSPFEIDLIEDFTIDAVNEATVAVTGGVIEIDALSNDIYDPNSPIEVDLIGELDANDVAAEVDANGTIDIDVLKNDNTGPGDIELDFADQP